jgi:hypothetical protein
LIEHEIVPNDSKVVDRTWCYVNKNGLPDRRYKDNYEIPIVLYYKIMINTKKGLNESYLFSNPITGQEFCNVLSTYKESLKKMKWKYENNLLEDKPK